MTGFGRGAAERNGVRAEVELKGVNHRFLEIKMRLPAEAAALEPVLRARVQKVALRGRVDLSVTLASSRPPSYRVEINRPLVTGYLKAAEALRRELRLTGSIGIETLLALPGAVAIEPRRERPDGALRKILLESLDRALAAYDAMRAEEGGRLARDLRARLQSVAGATLEIEREARGLPEAYAGRLRARVAVLLKEPGLEPARLAQEVALLADRLDITEEVVRLKGHVDQACTALERPHGAIGKTLDFLMQEMNREANTIASKAEEVAICQASLRIKSEVEKMREQIQNLE
jgi:uncharacterized protein (TIGR00255 family)